MVLVDSDGIPRVPPYSGALHANSVFRIQDFTFYGLTFQLVLLYFIIRFVESPTTPICKHIGLGSFPFSARRHLKSIFFLLFLQVLVSVPCVTPALYLALLAVGSPIRIFTALAYLQPL